MILANQSMIYYLVSIFLVQIKQFFEIYNYLFFIFTSIYYFFLEFNRRLLLTSRDIAVAAMIYKVRRLQNNKDIDSLCKLFNALSLDLFPKSMKAIQQQLHPHFDLNGFYKFYNICSNCGAYGSNSMFKCKSCNDVLMFKFYLCSIKQQIQ
jgi:hypothetical protein